MNKLKDFFEDETYQLLLLLIVVFVAFLALLIRVNDVEENKWAAFAHEHDCKVVGRISSNTSTGLGVGMMQNGQFGTMLTTVTTPAKTGYACNDGVTYWR